MNALGNDFILINNTEYKIKNMSEYSLKLCDRNFSVGADGVIYIEKENNLYKMRIFNKDGTEALMCGNGIRCFSKYLYDNKLIEKHADIITLSGLKKIEINEDNIIVNMGEFKIEEKDELLINVGNPHVVRFVSNFDFNIDEIGNELSKKYDSNVEFVKIIDKNNIGVRVYERGVGETYACGTGACASFIASYHKDYINNKVNVHLKGGVLKVYLDDGKLYMEGSANYSFKGII